jgi:hypothetical protein
MTTSRLPVAAAPIAWGQCEPAEGEGPRNDVARSLGYLQRALTEVRL